MRDSSGPPGANWGAATAAAAVYFLLLSPRRCMMTKLTTTMMMMMTALHFPQVIMAPGRDEGSGARKKSACMGWRRMMEGAGWTGGELKDRRTEEGGGKRFWHS